MLICDRQFQAVLSRQSSGRERKILEKLKKLKNIVKRMLELCATLFVFVCACVCVCVFE